MDKIAHHDGTSRATASPPWQQLERYAREKIQTFVQQLLEEEVDDLLGRKKSERRTLGSSVGYRNGYGKPRQLALTNGTITLRRPRVRDLDERFVSRVLHLFRRRTEEVGALLPELYLHGLALGDFELALRGLLGDGAPLSASSILRLKAAWQALLVVIGGLADGRKVILAVESGERESTESWAAVLRGLKSRGLQTRNSPLAMGIWGFGAR